LGDPREHLIADKPLAILSGDVLRGARTYILVQVLAIFLVM
jgi:hypothetical protein